MSAGLESSDEGTGRAWAELAAPALAAVNNPLRNWRRFHFNIRRSAGDGASYLAAQTTRTNHPRIEESSQIFYASQNMGSIEPRSDGEATQTFP